jgi:hypothetical protein
MRKGYVSPEMFAERVLAHGKIASLTTGFKFTVFIPFSIFVVPKSNVTTGVISSPSNAGLLVNCKCFQDDVNSNLPVLFNQWSEAAIIEIAVNAIDLDVYDVYWGACSDIPES